MDSHLIKLCKYNVWANDRICTWIKKADLKVDEELKSSFPSIRKTLYHLWDAQFIWLARLNGESTNTWPSHSFKGNLDEAIAGLQQNSLALSSHIEQLNESEYQRQVEFKSIDGTSYFNSVEEIITHVINHSTYHRGQLITLLRTVGFTTVDSTDFIRYLRSKEKAD
ncbi:MAG: DinB family protein [Bacteroidia bacterium]